nr:MAG TPA: hypothetical protein [Bacteriophage sp.]
MRLSRILSPIVIIITAYLCLFFIITRKCQKGNTFFSETEKSFF